MSFPVEPPASAHPGRESFDRTVGSEQGVAFARAIFTTARPVCVEIGPGRGEFLTATARQHPEWNFLAIEHSSSRARHTEAMLTRAQLSNARVVQGDAGCLIDFIPACTVLNYYVLFPDPWWKRRHHRRRLLTVEFVAALRRTLVLGGRIYFVTDVPAYFAHGIDLLGQVPDLETDHAAAATFRASTSFARKAHTRGAAIYAAVYRRALA